MQPLIAAPKRLPGRPLSFDREAALRQAMLLFWRYGYEATSLNQLTAAMRVKPPSIYAAFGDKKGLFRAAVELYRSGPVTSTSIIDNAATARDAASQLLAGAAIAFTGAATPRGCLLASAAISCSAEAADLQAELATIRREIQRRLRDKISNDVASGMLPSDSDADDWAGHVLCVIQGLSTLARDGASRRKLLRVAEVAMQHWPGLSATTSNKRASGIGRKAGRRRGKV